MRTYIPIKAPDGAPLGSLNIENDTALLKTKRPMAGKAFLFLEAGIVPIAVDVPLRTPSQVLAVGGSYDGKPTFYGIAPDSPLTRRKVFALLSQKDTMQHEVAKPGPPPLEKIEVVATIMSQNVLPDADTPVSDTVAAAASFSALLQRASAVYERISTQHPPMHRPIVADEPSLVSSASPTQAVSDTAGASAVDGEVSLKAVVDTANDSDISGALLPKTPTNENFDSEVDGDELPPKKADDAVNSDDSDELSKKASDNGFDSADESEILAKKPVSGDGVSSSAKLSPKTAASWLFEVDALLHSAVKSEPPSKRNVVSNPFVNIFPNSSWTMVSGEGIMPHLEGEWQRGNEFFKIIAVPGTYAPHPPKHLFGFTRFIRTLRGGYWVKLLDR